MTARVIIQIPCYQESGQLARTLAELPRELSGCPVEWLVIDDGSTDGTAEVARAHGVDHVVSLGHHRGLAVAFARGLESSVQRGADIIINTDADNQYCAADLPALIAPLLRHEADMCVGARPIAEIAHFSLVKKCLQRAGSAIVRSISGVDVRDATSGFRAFTREAALRINVFSSYSYTLETLIQAGQRGLRVACVPVRVNPPSRPSRLMRSTTSYVLRSTLSILHAFVVYRPFRFLAIGAVLFVAAGVILGLRFVFYYLTAGAAGHVQSLILAAILAIFGGLLLVAGIVADLLAINRRILEDVQAMLRRREWRP